MRHLKRVVTSRVFMIPVMSPLLQWSDYLVYVSRFPRSTEYPVLWYQSVLRKWMSITESHTPLRTENGVILQKNLSGARSTT
ncbi:unnamed protein product [Penicillium roqueforti FM164]|uniref:Genomic scaffold, ProqFM164S01 n=1 Tax=Penicillium roqueforti (strain FM164) TaxID=1365484 RepID=W6Q068_PENRF|nr:unnamed protein product [Penicillium roqueforti FM164]